MAETENSDPAKDIPPWLQPVPEADDKGGVLASGRMKIILAGAAVGVVIVFVAAVVFLYQDAPKEGPRHIAAESGPVRERPSDAGGMQVDHQDKEVLNIGDGAPATARVQIGAQPEQPVAEIPDLPEQTTEPVEDSADAIGDLAEAALEDEVQPAALPETDAPEQAPETSEEPARQESTDATAGQFMVQLGAYGSEQSAETAWGTIRGKFSDELDDLTPIYVPVESGDRTLYRLRVGMFPTRRAADSICIYLRTQQQACFVVNP